MSELIQLEMTLDEARETVNLAKRYLNSARFLLLEIRDRKGWKALGYASFSEFGEKEFGYDKSYLTRLADAGEISLQIGYSPELPMGNLPSERQLRPLAQVPEEARKAIWEEATRKAEEEQAKLTAKRIEEAVTEWKQRNEEWKVQWKSARDKAGQLQAELDIAKAILDQKPETPADYESTKAKAARLETDLAELKRQQAALVQKQVADKLKERAGELEKIDKEVAERETRLDRLQQQIDRYSLQQQELEVHLNTIESARVAMAVLAANLEGFGEVIDRDNELRLWRALSQMLKNGAEAIDYFVGDAKPRLAA